MRRAWIVMILAAVFSMHGTPALAAGDGASHSTGGTATSAGSVVVADGADASAAADAPHRTGAEPVGATGAPASSDQDAGHVHLWAACLAVLLAAVSLLGAALLLRKAAGRLPAAIGHRVTRSTGWCRVPRPPDIFALCIQRT